MNYGLFTEAGNAKAAELVEQAKALSKHDAVTTADLIGNWLVDAGFPEGTDTAVREELIDALDPEAADRRIEQSFDRDFINALKTARQQLDAALMIAAAHYADNGGDSRFADAVDLDETISELDRMITAHKGA